MLTASEKREIKEWLTDQLVLAIHKAPPPGFEKFLVRDSIERPGHVTIIVRKGEGMSEAFHVAISEVR